MALLSATKTLQIAFLQAIAREGDTVTIPHLVDHISVVMCVDKKTASRFCREYISPCLRELRLRKLTRQFLLESTGLHHWRLTHKGEAIVREFDDLDLDEAILSYLRWRGVGRQHSLFDNVGSQELAGEAASVSEAPSSSLGSPEICHSGILSTLQPREQKKLQELLNTPFDLTDIADERESKVRDVVQRRGQGFFRTMLLALYDGRCAITGCDVEDVLEAAHIIGYQGEKTNHPANGLLLRADLHTLFDLGLLTIDTGSMTVRIAPKLSESCYAALAGTRLRLPGGEYQICTEALDMHRAWAEQTWRSWNE